MKEVFLLEVSGESCANFFSLLPIASKLAAERGIVLKHIEASAENAEEVRRLNIERVPALLLMDGEREAARCYGYQPEEILQLWLDAKLQEIFLHR